MILLAYSALWKLARPFLRRHKRMGEGFEQRLVPYGWPESSPSRISHINVADSPCPVAHQPYRLWLHGASGGEAYLVHEIVRELAVSKPALSMLCTSCTSQGLEVLENMRQELSSESCYITVNYFPLDEPALMNKAVRRVYELPPEVSNGSLAPAESPGHEGLGLLAPFAPRAAVLFETEIWPGFLQACRLYGVDVFVMNGRMSQGSFKAYKHIRRTLRNAPPKRIFATAQADLERFSAIFDDAKKVSGSASRCALMPNIKFDRVRIEAKAVPNPLEDLFGASPPPVIALASVREEEEKLLTPLVANLLACAPQSCVVVAPRHMHRLEAWKVHLKNFNFTLRSELKEFKAGQAVLWDTFGELNLLYSISSVVFVGGSLRPLGGQNFLEPLSYGIVPCIGPYWSNFYWVGNEIFTLGLVRQVQDASELASVLLQQLQKPVPRGQIKKKLAAYLKPRQGGARMAADYLNSVLWTEET